VKIQIKTSLDLQAKTDCLVVALKSSENFVAEQSELNTATNQSISKLKEAGLFDASEGQIITLPVPEGIAAQKLILVGVGNQKSFNIEQTRTLLEKIANQFKLQKITQATLSLDALIEQSDIETVSRHLVEAIGDSQYRYIKSPVAARDTKPEADFSATLCVSEQESAAATTYSAIGSSINNGKTAAKNLANMPGNVCTPTFLAEHAQTLGQSHGIKVEVLSEEDMAELGMGSLLSVSKGSREPAKLIVMQYNGAQDPEQAPHALVGKGLTFDAGGISIKPSPKMDEMKYDMCGAASVFGAIQAAAELKLPINIVGVVPSSENLPDGLANKPGDVVTSMSGQTIEILNTDAEGRLLLCDALTYVKHFKPQSVIDIATLTGAIIVALGHQTAGVMGNDQGVIDNLISAGDTSLDTAWQLPIKETYKQQLRSDYADLANIGSPGAGSITAACFLSYFTEDLKWAHLDIAGTAWGGKYGKRASGRAVPILTQYLIDRSKSAS